MAGFSLMNGLSAMGSAVATTAGTAALAQQKAQLAEQGAAMAASLAHQYRTAEIGQQGSIQAGIVAQQGTIQSGIVGQQVAGEKAVAATEGAARLAAAQAEAAAQLGAAKIGAAASEANVAADIASRAPLIHAQAKGAFAQAQLVGDQAVTAQKALDISLQLAAEAAKPAAQQDQGKINQLQSERASLLLDPTLQAKFLGSIGTMVHGASQLVAADQANEAHVLAQEATLNMGDPNVRAKQDALLAEARAQTEADASQLRTYEMLSRGLIPNGSDATAPASTTGAPVPPPGAAAWSPAQYGAPAKGAPGPVGPRPGLLNSGAVPPPLNMGP